MIGWTLEEIARSPFAREFELHGRFGGLFLPRGYKMRPLVRLQVGCDPEGRASKLDLRVVWKALRHPCLGPPCRALVTGFLERLEEKPAPGLTRFLDQPGWAGEEVHELATLRVRIRTRGGAQLLVQVRRKSQKVCTACRWLADEEDNFCARCGRRLESRSFWNWLRR